MLSVLRHSYIYSLDSGGLFGEVITEQQITGFIQATFSEAQATHTKAPEVTIYAFVITDLLPKLFHGTCLGFSNIATDIVHKS